LTSIVRGVTAVAVSAVLACGGDGTSPSGGGSVSAITLTFTSTTLALGDLQNMGPVFKGPDGATLPTAPSATWTSSNSQIASVDATGRVRGVKLGGPVTIKVTSGGATATASISVIPDRVFFPSVPASIGVGTTLQLVAEPLDIVGNPIPASQAPVVWTTSNSSVATIDGSGLVTGVGTGMTHITATAAGQSNALDLEGGVISQYDGSWSGQSVGKSLPVDLIVLFGTVRSFKLTYILFTLPYSHLCESSVTAFGSPNAPTASGQFSFNLVSPPTVVVTGTFTSSTTMTGTHTTMSLGSFPCNFLDNGEPILPPNNNPINANVPASTFNATKLPPPPPPDIRR
jgi:hypothetical protein